MSQYNDMQDLQINVNEVDYHGDGVDSGIEVKNEPPQLEKKPSRFESAFKTQI